MRMLLACIVLFLTAGCSGAHYAPYYAKRALPLPSAESIPHCYNYGCKDHEIVQIPPALAADIAALFTPPSSSAAEERARIAQAVQRFEQSIGAITGTEVDKAKTFQALGPYQQDCVDESINTTSALIALRESGHISFHRIGPPQSRLPIFTGRWPHQTAAIYENETGQGFAVDSWFHDNGAAPEIVPLAVWKKGWSPAQ